MQDTAWVTGSGSEVRSLVKETVVNAPSLEVWSAWTSSEGINAWWGPPDSRIELRIGGPFEIIFLPEAPPGRQGGEGCRFLSYIPGKMLAFTWNATPDHPLRDQFTWVVLTFDALDDGTTAVRLVHTGFLEGSDWDSYMNYFTDAWARVLEMLKHHWDQGRGPDSSDE